MFNMKDLYMGAWVKTKALGEWRCILIETIANKQFLVTLDLNDDLNEIALIFHEDGTPGYPMDVQRMLTPMSITGFVSRFIKLPSTGHLQAGDEVLFKNGQSAVIGYIVTAGVYLHKDCNAVIVWKEPDRSHLGYTAAGYCMAADSFSIIAYFRPSN